MARDAKVCRIGVEQSLGYRKIQDPVQKQIDIDDRLGRQALHGLLMVIEHLEHSGRNILLLDLPQHRPQMIADVELVGQVSRLLDAGAQVHLQTQPQPLLQGAFFKGSGFGIIEKGQLVQDLDRLFFRFCVTGNAMGGSQT